MSRAHLLGIGGAGVSALARVYLARGVEVTGCDLRESDSTRALADAGAAIAIGHSPEHVRGQDLVVYSGAVHSSGGELEAARELGVRVLTRAQALAELIRDSDSIAVAGSHGKTTVTHMLGGILGQAGWDPTVLVGDGLSSRAGHSRWLVAEADESDGSLALHRPAHAIVTSIEMDHPDHFASVEEVDALFRRWLAQVRPGGVAVVSADDARTRALPVAIRRVTYGFAGDADYRCTDERPFGVWHQGRLMGSVELGVPGRHNVHNATAALAMAIELGVPFETAAAGLAGFRGAHRRLEAMGTWRGVRIYDDYGHHPTEVAATIGAARELGPRRLVVVFQPHRFTRLRALIDGFGAAFEGADEVIVTEVYAAGEEPGEVGGADLAKRVPGAHYAPTLESAREQAMGLAGEGDVLLLMGAGDVWKIGRDLVG